MSKKAQQQHHIHRRKLLAKRNHHHHLYKTQQRQTRARNKQIVGQTVKILNKSRNKKQQQITKNISVKTVRQSKRNVRLRNLQKQKQQQQQQQELNKKLSKTTATTTTTTAAAAVAKKSDSEERSSRSLTPKQQMQKENKNEKITTNSVTTTTCTITTATTTICITTTATCCATTTTTTTMHEMFEYANSNASSTSTCTTNTLNSAASIPTTTTTIGATNTRKRSKRISDCIAMLTGKLEEKLKTEQQPIATTRTTIQTPVTPTKVATETNVVNESTIRQQQQQEIPPKTPKRKAQSRRILKPPSIENIVAQVEATIATPTTIVPITASMAVKATTIPPCPTATCLPPSSPAAPANKAVMKNKPVISLTAIPTTTTAVLPLPIIQVAENLLPPPPPQLPLLPKKNVAATLTVAARATPVISVESNTKTTTHQIKQNTINLPLPLPLALPVGVPLPTAMPIQLRPILQSNINNSNKFFEEPLNLSNASKNDMLTPGILQNTNTLVNTTYRSNIYDLDMTQQIYQQQADVGPLDLSIKSYRNQTNEMTASSIASIMPLALTVIPTSSNNLKTNTQPLTFNNLATSSAAATMSTSAALFINECNKHFYSNLDLLKIPQVRSQLAALAATTTIPVYSSSHVVENNISTITGHMLPGATKATMVVAPIVKKRGNNRQQQQQYLYNNIATTTTTSSAAATIPTTRIIRLYPNKKEHQLTMNEEVINHIDDAINSVINAVKASLTPERADDELEKNTILTTTTTTATTTTIATVLPTTITTHVIPASNTNVNNTITTTSTISQPPLAPIMPIKRRGRSKIAEHPLSTTATTNEVAAKIVIPATAITTTTTVTATTTARKSKIRSNLCLVEDIRRIEPEIGIAATVTTTYTETATTKTDNIVQEQQLTEQLEFKDVVVVEQKPTTTTSTTTTEKLNEAKKFEKDANVVKPTTPPSTCATTIEKELENISEQPAPPAQKKFRRRRRNELAAIVADQLLESFKIDKARRDSLKKLENLAYEHKSDDLFMTGMLLMSSTKRSVTMNNAQKQQQINELETATTKRTSLRNRQNTNNNNNGTITTTTPAKRGRRAGSSGASRGKTLNNKNISKLKSSLATFSIGIERQLTEFEAKKELQQQQQQAGNKSNVVNLSNNNNNNNNTTTKLNTPSILRPSILSAAAAPLTAENVAKISEQSRSAFACRDPRLNKNIHKETDEESLHKKWKQTAEVPPHDYEEEDNYLTEIAKNVNEKIMAAENEDFMFANDGLLQLDDTSSQFYSRPATSMSVRSAPNFDDRSDFGSLCGDDDDDEEEHTNTEVMDMDLDDEMSVYTSYSQDLGRTCGRSRRRRRRRSILLTRRPKKRVQRNQQDTQKFECTLCKKIFFSATSLSKHNMTLAHVSKVSEQEYLLSKAALLDQGIENVLSEFPSLPKPNTTRRAKTPTPTTNTTNRARKTQAKTLDDATTIVQLHNNEPKAPTPLATQNASHIGLNSDERLFFECCTILTGTPHEKNNTTAQKQDDSNDFSPYQYHLDNKIMADSKKNDKNSNKTSTHKKHTKSQSTFRDPPDYNKHEK